VIQEFLRNVEIFRDLEDDDLAEVLTHGMLKRHPAGAMLLVEGSPGGALHIIHEGQVRISKSVPTGGEEALAILAPGDFFGEIEFFDGAPASANAVAHTECEVLSIPHEEVRELMTHHPEMSARFLWAFGRTLAYRLREMNERVAGFLAISRAF
jgi:CRP/FNR family transcriptional regulator, cyclic AMP receptor protein